MREIEYGLLIDTNLDNITDSFIELIINSINKNDIVKSYVASNIMIGSDNKIKHKHISNFINNKMSLHVIFKNEIDLDIIELLKVSLKDIKDIIGYRTMTVTSKTSQKIEIETI